MKFNVRNMLVRKSWRGKLFIASFIFVTTPAECRFFHLLHYHGHCCWKCTDVYSVLV